MAIPQSIASYSVGYLSYDWRTPKRHPKPIDLIISQQDGSFSRGIKCNWSDVHYWTTNIGSVTVELELSANDLSGSSATIKIDYKEQGFKKATGEISLDAYQMIILYINDPSNITLKTLPAK